MSASLTNRQTLTKANPIAKISAQARVDYILKFTKHPAVVLSAQKTSYSKVASQFLTLLPESNNAAFISASEKLTNIQLRCRIIEQLFHDAVFDPEQPLYLTVARLIKQQPQAITIVIEHAHFLTQQMLHELCQLSELIKTAKASLGIALFADLSLGTKLAQERTVFEKRLTLVDADQGQLLSIKAKCFKAKSSLSRLTNVSKLIWLSTIVLSLTGGLYWLFLKGVVLPQIGVERAVQQPAEQFVLEPQVAEKLKAQPTTSAVEGAVAAQRANPQDVVQAILSEIPVPAKQPPTPLAKPNDILQALQISQPTESSAKTKLSIEPQQLNLPSAKPELKPLSAIDADYYGQWRQGFVIQYAGFSEQATYQQFIMQYPELSYFAYHRIYQHADNLVLTSMVYSSRQQALIALADLPESLRLAGAWIKSVQVIQQEINEFNLTH
jgi:DamX protein